MNDSSLRRHVVDLLGSSHAHVGFDGALRAVPGELRCERREGQQHTLWQLLEHLRIAQWDILGFSRSADHVSPKWPDGYWPETDVLPDEGAWEQSLEAFRSDLEAMVELVREPSNDLFAPIVWGEGQTILREALLLVDHNAYHIGQVVALRRLLDDWPPDEGAA